jgi:hypothetical protein
MNRLSTAERAKVVNCLIEGCSLRSTVRLTGVAKKTVARILVEVGEACASYHDKIMRNLPCKVIQVDEVWSFTYEPRFKFVVLVFFFLFPTCGMVVQPPFSTTPNCHKQCSNYF